MRCRFHPSAVTQIQRWFLVLQLLSFRYRFLDQHWHRVFDDSMRQTWIYFCYRFHASVVNSLTVSPPYSSCHSYFRGDFRVYSDFVLGDDFSSVVTQFSLTIPCVNDDSRFSFEFVRQQWIRMRCRFHPSAVSHFQRWFLVLQWLSFAADFWISTGIVCLTIPCVKHEYIFAIGFSPRSWILWRWRPHTSAATHIRIVISRSTLTLF
jgi:hypothetical protein